MRGSFSQGEPSVFEKSKAGRRGVIPPRLGIPRYDESEEIGPELVRGEPPALPELSELQVIRHFTRLAHLNYSIDSTMVPLGSCTMKYNPRINEVVASMPEFKDLHPMSELEYVQGALRVMYELQQYLQEITGMDEFSLQPAAGAHGELTALLMVSSYYRNKGEVREVVLVPDSSHGTNPASASLAGFRVVTIPSNQEGDVDLVALREHLGENVACLMLTNPSTLGLFERNISEIADLVHKAGGMLYYDGANMNALLGKVRPGDMGFDLVHLNLHKTFSTPHGGGGPGAGPVGARGELVYYLPAPLIGKKGEKYVFRSPAASIGRMRMYWGNFLVLLRAFSYIRRLGASGLEKVAESAVTAANYLLARLKRYYDCPYPRRCMHEFVLSVKSRKAQGVRAMDVAKRLLDYGFYAPTVYFPLIVDEALMIEPTETENKESLDQFAAALINIAQEDSQLLRGAPHRTPVNRLDEVRAARHPILRWEDGGSE